VSRFDYDEYHQDFENQGAFWGQALKRALEGKRGKQALADLREALLALPAPRLISSAVCTVGKDTDPESGYGEAHALIEREGEGVCAVGAYAWHKMVKGGMDPAEAFAALPMLPAYDHSSWETAELGRHYGLRLTLATELAYRNDESFQSLTPEERYTAFLEWIDKQLAEPVAA
jgi:hypothetical protein